MSTDWDTLFADVVPVRKAVLNPRPPIPATGWKRPTSMPSLRGAGRIAIDTETFDPDLEDYGAGWARGAGEIVGVSIATDDGFVGYYPLRHREEAEDNFDPEQVFSWLRRELAGPQLKVFHNASYDVGFLCQEGVHISGPIYDSYIAEKLICHQDEATLEATAKRRVGGGKSSAELYAWLHAYYGKGSEPTPKALRKMIALVRDAPPRLAGPYAESDTLLPLQIATVQEKILEDMGLGNVFRMECMLIPLLVEMRMAGVSVDIPAAEKADCEFGRSIVMLQAEVDYLAGTTLNTGSGDEVGRVFDRLGIKYPLTDKTKKASIKAEFLQTVDHPLAEKIVELEELKKYRGTFVQGFILDSNKNGKVFPELNAVRAITGRMSCSNPNLQQTPSRNHLAKMIRSIFVPDAGHSHWESYDYNSVESRVFAHFAVGPGSQDLRDEYNRNPDLDMHSWNQETVHRVAGVLLDRKHIKGIVFSRLFGASDKKQAKMLKMSPEEAAPVLSAFADGLPYVGTTLSHYSRQVQNTGETRTILGRRVGFDTWEAMEGRSMALPFEKALNTYGNRIKRAYGHKATNYIIQGSACDLMKAFLVSCWHSGVFAETSVPRLVVHDSVELSMPDNTPARRSAMKEMVHIMETAVKFAVPIRTEGSWGSSWGSLQKIT